MCVPVRVWPRPLEGSPMCTRLCMCTVRSQEHLQLVRSRPCQAWGLVLEPEVEHPQV